MQKKFVVKVPFHNKGREWWMKQLEDCMEACEEPGMPDIKWCELYFKWGRYVPQEKKKDFKYYSERPPKDMIEKVKGNSKENKATRKGRGRTTKTDLEGDIDD